MFRPVKAFLVFTQLRGFNSHKMALFRYGFTVQNNSQSDSVNCDTVPSIPASFPSQENTSLVACSAGVFFERAICSRKCHVETSRMEEEVGRVKGSGEGAGREKRKRLL